MDVLAMIWALIQIIAGLGIGLWAGWSMWFVTKAMWKAHYDGGVFTDKDAWDVAKKPLLFAFDMLFVYPLMAIFGKKKQAD